MDYVKTLRRIAALQKALPRAEAYADRHSDNIAVDIDFRIQGKIEVLQNELNRWKADAEHDHAQHHMRYRQIRTACRILGLDWISTLHDWSYRPA